MDLFDTLMLITIIDLESQVRAIENESLIIPNWLFRQTRTPIRQQVGRIERRLSIPEQTEDLPIIPDLIFQENSSQNDSQYIGGRFGLAEAASSYFTSQFVEIYNRPENQAHRQRRCWCGLCNLEEQVKITETKEKLIEIGKNDECPITYESINYGDSYLCCKECKYNFSEQAILKHLNGNSIKKECPMCRSEWKDYCRYINKDSMREKQEELKQWLSLPKNEIKHINKLPYNKDIQMYINDINKTRYNKKWYYGK